MENSQTQSVNDGILLFAEESKTPSSESEKKYKLLIVDDENEIHVLTKLVLADYEYQGAGLNFLSAFSGKQAKVLIKENPDIACCLLDVVMETKDAGLEVARFIREDANNKKLRIILRTGQPGKAPEKDIILNYDINDYKEKTELTNQKLFTTITTALRSYDHLEELEEKSREIHAKNIRLNEEISRRIVAESNLTKYNRSLEKMIESKSNRLKEAIRSLEITKDALQKIKKATIASDISILSIDTVDTSNTLIESNLNKMNQYRQTMTQLLEKYNLLEKIILSHSGEDPQQEKTNESIQKIDAYKAQIDFNTLLKDYPGIITESLRGIEQISNAVSDIKLFVSINEEPFQPTDLCLLLEEITIARKEIVPKNIDIQSNLEKVPAVFLPPRHVESVFNEILDNSIHAIQSHGIVSISCQYLEPHIIVCIRDIGCGISKEDLPHIFKPYFTGDKSKGKGLGLAFAKSVIQSCEGDLEITSSLNEGTMVQIVLPVKETGT